jgi:hypothetical protein
MERHIGIAEPTHIREFLLIVVDALTPRSLDDVPQRYVNVARSKTDGRSACDHQWFSDVMPSNETELLAKLARYGFSGMFLWLDVASGWEPELRSFVIYEKDFASVNYRKVRDQMFRWSGWFRGTKERCA